MARAIEADSKPHAVHAESEVLTPRRHPATASAPLAREGASLEKWIRLLVVLASFLLIVAFVAVVVRLALYIPHTLLLFALGGLLAYALNPLVEFLCLTPPWRGGRPMPRGAAISTVFIVLALLIGGGIYALSRPLSHEIRQLSDPRFIQAYKTRTIVFLNGTDDRLGRMGIHVKLAEYIVRPQEIPRNVQDIGVEAEKQAWPIVRDTVVSIGEGVIVVLIALYLLIFGSELRRLFNRNLPEKLLVHAEVWQEDVSRILGGFVRGQLIIALIMGTAAAIVCLAVGIHLWLLIGLFVVGASLIPVFGPYLGAIPAVVLALIGPTRVPNNIVAALIILGMFVLINESGSKILYPRLVGKAIGLHDVIVLFVIFAGLELGGVVGVLFAAPFTAMVLVTVVHLYRFWQDLPDSLLSKSATTVEHHEVEHLPEPRQAH